MKTITKITKGRHLRRGIIYFLTCNLVLNTWLPAVFAEVVLDSVVNGNITVTPLGGGVTQDMTASDGAIGHFSDFDIAAGHVVSCIQPNSNASALFRVFSGDGTQILGQFNANGNIYLIDPAGILFGAGSQVNVNRLVASSLDISNEDFLGGRHEFFAGAGDVGAIVNNGTINAAEGVALIGRKILNTGTITTGEGGFVVMAAGERVLLGVPGSNVLVKMDSVTMSDDGGGDVINDGLIRSKSGTVVLAAGDMFASALELEKVSGGIGRVEQNGTIDADGISGDGGNVILTAADEVVLSGGSLTKANAGTNGDSGLVVVHSTGRTAVEANAKIEARGGYEPYDIIDDFDDVVDTSVEISGDYVNFAGDVDASAMYGKRGKVIIDALYMTIADGYMPDAPPDNTVYEKWIESQSYASTDVELVAHAKTGGNIIAEPISDGVIEGGSGDIVLRTKYDTGGIEFMPGPNGDRAAIHTTQGGNVYMLAGEGGIAIGDIISYVPQHAPAEWIVEPGKIRLLTTNYGDITTGRLSVYGGSYDEISVIASGDLLINGDVTTYAHQVDEDLEVGQAITCLVSKHGDVEINGVVTVEAHAKYKSTADIHIDAGRDVRIDLGGGQIRATALTSAEGTANASVLIHAGKDTEEGEKGNIIITNPKSADKAIYLRAQTQGYKSEIYSDGKAPADTEVKSSRSRAKLELDEKHTGYCPECPTPPGLVPPLDPWAFVTHMGYSTSGNVFADENKIGILEVIPGESWEELTPESWQVQTSHGTLIIAKNGDYVYTPNDGYVGDDSFAYQAKVESSGVETDWVVVSITMINELPVASPGSASGHMGISIENEPLNYYDVPDELGIIDEDLTVNIVTEPLYGDVTLQWDETSQTWTYTYVPKNDGTGYYAGTDSFVYTVTDPQGTVGPSGTAQVTINITNDLPVAVDDSFITDQGVSIGGNVLENDFDQNYDPLSVVLNGSSPQHGQLVLNEDGTFTYVPNEGFSGKDSFTYLITDGQKCDELPWATVTITVSPIEQPSLSVIASALQYIPPTPGLERVEFEISGCPALIKWAAAELGIDERMIQIWAVNTLASSQDIQPCDACEKLKQVAAILRDDGGARVAALAQVVGELASNTAPPTPEQMASVADAIASNAQANNHYAVAGEYLDALVAYVGVLNNELSFSTEESIMFAVDKYVAPLAENQNAGLAAYVAARLADLGGS